MNVIPPGFYEQKVGVKCNIHTHQCMTRNVNLVFLCGACMSVDYFAACVASTCIPNCTICMEANADSHTHTHNSVILICEIVPYLSQYKATLLFGRVLS